MLTVPNVYSLPHAREVQEFVRAAVGIARVDFVYESDALAFYLFEPSACEEVREFAKEVVRPQDRNEVRILTLDIGRGTTDASLVRIFKRQVQEESRTHCVLSRTGSCSGGQRLTYLLARFYNERLHEFCKALTVQPRFDFVTPTREYKLDQQKVNRTLEELIEAIKRAIREDFTLDDSLTQQPLIENLYGAVCSILGWADGDSKRNSSHAAFDAAFTLPLLLRKQSFVVWLLSKIGIRIAASQVPRAGSLRVGWLLSKIGILLSKIGIRIHRRQLPASQEPGYITQLADHIEAYVAENVNDILIELLSIAREREKAQLDPSCWKGLGNPIDPDCTFALIGGQAAQFRPIVSRVRDFLEGTFHIPAQQICFIPGEEAKGACAKGAVAFTKARSQIVNPNEFFGTYGVLAAVPPMGESPFRAADCNELIRKGSTIVRNLDAGDFYFVFVAKALCDVHEGTAFVPALLDGYTAVVSAFGKGHSRDLTIGYDTANNWITLDGAPIKAVGTHGYVTESIHPKIWPVVLQRQGNEPRRRRHGAGTG